MRETLDYRRGSIPKMPDYHTAKRRETNRQLREEAMRRWIVAVGLTLCVFAIVASVIYFIAVDRPADRSKVYVGVRR